MKTVDVQLNRLAAGQHSLAQYKQALDLGMTPRQVQDRVEAGLLVPVHRGEANILVAHGWRLHFTYRDVRRRWQEMLARVARELVVAWPA